MDFKFPIFLYFLLLFPTKSLSCISVVKKTKADAVNAIANTLTDAAGIVLSSIPKVNILFSLKSMTSWFQFSGEDREMHLRKFEVLLLNRGQVLLTSRVLG